MNNKKTLTPRILNAKLVAVLALVLYFVAAPLVSAACNTNFDCGNNGFVASPYYLGNSIYQNYITYTCNNPGTVYSTCSNTITQQFVSAYNGNQYNQYNLNICTSHTLQKCSGNGVYWFDSCGNQQESVQACGYNQTCSNNSCINVNTTNTNIISPTCTYHSFQRCSANAVYWYDSCGNQQDVAQTCGYNQTCSSNTCIGGQNQNNANITVTIMARNLSVGNLNWSSVVNAKPSDILQFQITTQTYANPYPYQNSNSFTVRDSLPAGLLYDNNLTLDGAIISGDITSGITLNNTPNQTRTITYQAKVASNQNFNFAATTLNSTATVTNNAYGNPATAIASVIVNGALVSGATSVSTGLTNNIWVDSFILPLLLAGVGLWLVKSGIVGMPKWASTRMTEKKETAAGANLQNRVREIKQKEKKA